MDGATRMSTPVAEESKLLSSPPEIRNMIYSAVLVRDAPFETEATHNNFRDLLESMRVLQVCSQVRNEPHEIFWSENRVEVKLLPDREEEYLDWWWIDPLDTDSLHGWSDKIGRDRARLIRSLTFTIQQICPVPEQPECLIQLKLSKLETILRAILHQGVTVASIKAAEPLTVAPDASDLDRAYARIAAEWKTRTSMIVREESGAKSETEVVMERPEAYQFGWIELRVFD